MENLALVCFPSTQSVNLIWVSSYCVLLIQSALDSSLFTFDSTLAFDGDDDVDDHHERNLIRPFLWRIIPLCSFLFGDAYEIEERIQSDVSDDDDEHHRLFLSWDCISSNDRHFSCQQKKRWSRIELPSLCVSPSDSFHFIFLLSAKQPDIINDMTLIVLCKTKEYDWRHL